MKVRLNGNSTIDQRLILKAMLDDLPHDAHFYLEHDGVWVRLHHSIDASQIAVLAAHNHSFDIRYGENTVFIGQ